MKAKDFINRSATTKCDETVYRLDLDYAMGGVEYFEKIMSRNALLRLLMLDEVVKKVYNLHGDQIHGLLRFKEVPYSERRQMCGMVVKVEDASQ